jgi:hypothetical protein
MQGNQSFSVDGQKEDKLMYKWLFLTLNPFSITCIIKLTYCATHLLSRKPRRESRGSHEKNGKIAFGQ